MELLEEKLGFVFAFVGDSGLNVEGIFFEFILGGGGG